MTPNSIAAWWIFCRKVNPYIISIRTAFDAGVGEGPANPFFRKKNELNGDR